MSHIFWKLLIWRFIWYTWGPATCILWPVIFFVKFCFATGSISWYFVIDWCFFRLPCLLPFLKRKCLIFSCSPGWFCAQILWSTPDLRYICYYGNSVDRLKEKCLLILAHYILTRLWLTCLSLNKSLSAPKWCMLGKSDSNQTRLNFQSGISIFAGKGNLLVSVKAEKWNDCFFVKSSYFLSFFATVLTNSSRRIFLECVIFSCQSMELLAGYYYAKQCYY